LRAQLLTILALSIDGEHVAVAVLGLSEINRCLHGVHLRLMLGRPKTWMT